MELPRRASDEKGLSLVEVLVGMTIAMMALAGMGGMLITSARSQNVSEQRVFASQLATQAIEQVQARNWDLIGFWASDNGYQANATASGVSLPTVTFTSAAPPTTNRPLPLSTVSRNGVTYNVRTDILWEDPALPEADRSRKHLLTVVSWTDGRGQTQSVTAASLRAWPPVQRGPSLFFLVSATAGATAQLIDEYGFPLAPVPLAAVTNRLADDVVVAYTERSGATGDIELGEVAPTGGQTTPQGYAGTLEGPNPALSAPLSPYATSPVPAPGSGIRFANGTTYLTFNAVSSTYPADSRSVAVTFLHDRVYVVPGSVTASVPFCVNAANRRLSNTVRVSFDVQGFQAADRAQVSWLSTNVLSTSVGSGPASHLATAAPRGTRQYFDIPANTTLPGALVTFTIVTDRTTALPATGLVNLPVSFPVAVAPC